MQESRRLQLGRDLLDGLVDIGGLAGAGTDELPASEEEKDDLRLVDAIHEAGELLWFVLDLPQPEGDRDRIQIDLRPEVRRRDDILDRNLGFRIHLDAGGRDLFRDEVDRGLHILEALRPGAHDLPAPEQEDRGFRLLQAKDQARELLRFVLGTAKDAGDRLEVEFLPEGRRGNDVLDFHLRQGTT